MTKSLAWALIAEQSLLHVHNDNERIGIYEALETLAKAAGMEREAELAAQVRASLMEADKQQLHFLEALKHPGSNGTQPH